jgi:hypothetical protein
MADGEVRMRLIRADDAPTSNPLNEPFAFGLQDTKQQITPGGRDGAGRLVFDFSLAVKVGKDPSRPAFGGRFAAAPPTTASSISPGARSPAGSGSTGSRPGSIRSTGRWCAPRKPPTGRSSPTSLAAARTTRSASSTGG